MRPPPQDKEARRLRQEQSNALKQEQASSAAVARAEFSDATHATLNIRTEDGALRHRFEATATLAQVREWLLEEQNRTVIPQPASHVLSADADAELVRAGRENFQRQVCAWPHFALPNAQVASRCCCACALASFRRP